ncbi:UvrD-helicase domain-containing protein [Flavobacterium sp. '19STA2R22 D10 B1']|uniref:UvrD-helicase domain-containing protein n=1 Tax=Flavobacterium aerium TaxID=3037261 RepID=UPI00278BDEB6|nr:UvrD-helicase domain-containing protein [Flavobacterium sp. '19STA2R22 D10 B1']
MNQHSFSIYDASAGSGKTFTLVKEYLKILLTSNKNDAYRNILAITFTNKAVGEMKSRIVSSLSEFAKDNPDKKAFQLMELLVEETGLKIPEIKSKAQRIIKNIIHNYAAFDISTIDKFTHKVIRAFAHDLNLPLSFDVSLETENLLIEAVDAIIAKAGEEETLTQLLVDFTMEKTDDDKSWDVTREILDVSKLLVNENNRNEVVHFQDKTIGEFVAIKKKLTSLCSDLEKEIVELAKNALQSIDEKGISYSTFNRSLIPNYLIFLADGKVEKREHLLKYLEEGSRYAKTKPLGEQQAIDAMADELLKIFQSIFQIMEKLLFYKAFLKNITPLSLLNTVSQELSKIQEEQNILSISEFNAIIHREIQNQPAPFIYERLGERYKHFFIDEFQDTSEMQWQNLIPLIDNALSGEDHSGDKGTLMIVGDPKQSIYRWRGGKAEQFIELSKGYNPFNNPDKVLEHLDKNYRSYSQVIQFNNDFFKLLSNEFTNLDYSDLYANHSHQKINDKEGGYVNLSFIPNTEGNEYDEESLDKTQLYLQSTLVTIKKVLDEGFDYHEIVILTRKKDQGIAVANYLTEQSVPIVSSETLMVQNATEVRMIVNTLRYLKNSADVESKALFLHYVGEYIQDELPVHDFISAGMLHKNEKDFEDWLMSFHIELSFQNVRSKSLYESVEIIISKFINKEKNNAYVQYFLDLVLERDVKNQAGVTDFLAYWDKNAHKFSIPSPEGNNAIRIMTIHKSKGLEFPVVIIPFAEEDYCRKPKDKLWLDIEETVFGLPKVLIDNSSAVEAYGEEASLVYLNKRQEELLDNINVLYVALTRAEEQLYIISSMNLSKKGEVAKNSMSTFFIKYLEEIGMFDPSRLEYSWGSSKKTIEDKKTIDLIKTIPPIREVLNPKAIKIAKREALMWGTHQQKAIEYGNLIHEILSYIVTADDVDLAIARSIENGLITFDQKEQVEQTIKEIVFHQDLSIYFSSKNTVFNEQTIIQKEGGIIKPDRMVVDSVNQVYLLDYKTGAHNQKYQAQLEHYQLAIEQMGYVVVKKALVYTGEEVKIVNL